MRKGSGGMWIPSETGQMIGINLGSDPCTEHEVGIQRLRDAFGVPKTHRTHILGSSVAFDIAGADSRTMTKSDYGVTFFADLDGYAYLYSSRYYGTTQTAKRLNQMLEAYSDDELVTAWDEESFGIRMKLDPLGHTLSCMGQLFEAFKTYDIMFFFGGNNGNPFSNSGLVIAIRSRMPAEVLQQMRDADVDYLDLMDAVDKIEKETSLKARLKETGHRYYALSPRWVSKMEVNWGKPIDTKYPAIFLLNPCDQRSNNFGWYTVEDLLQWIDGEGPIPTKEKK